MAALLDPDLVLLDQDDGNPGLTDEDGGGSDVDEPASKKRAGGRPPDPIRSHFHCLMVRFPGRTPTGRTIHNLAHSCNYCSHTIRDSRPDNLKKHICHDCKKVPADVRAEVTKIIAKGKDEVQKTTMDAFISSTKIPTGVKDDLDRKCTVFLVHSGSSFQLVEDEYFKMFVETLKPGYKLPGNPRYGGIVCMKCMKCSRAVACMHAWVHASMHAAIHAHVHARWLLDPRFSTLVDTSSKGDLLALATLVSA